MSEDKGAAPDSPAGADRIDKKTPALLALIGSGTRTAPSALSVFGVTKLQMSPTRIVGVLAAVAVLAVGVVFGYLGLVAEPQNQFAAFGFAKRLILPAMYCAFALMLVWPSRAQPRAVSGRLPIWWWLLLLALAVSSALSLFYGPGLLAYLQGVALFGGALVIAFAGFLTAHWTPLEKRTLFLVLTALSVVALAARTTGYTPFVSLLVPSAGAAVLLAVKVRQRRRLLVLVAAVLCAGAVIAATSGGASTSPTSIAVLAEFGSALTLLLILCAPFALRRYLAIGSLILVACLAVASDYIPMFLGASDYRDVTLAHRGFEAGRVSAAVFASPWTALFGLGPGGVVDLTESPDALTLIKAGRVVEAVPSVHLLTSHMLLKLGLVGIVALIAIVVAILRQVWLIAIRQDIDVFDGALAFYVVTGLASAVPAATNFFANPLPLLFLAILTARNGRNERDQLRASTAASPAGFSRSLMSSRLRSSGAVVAVAVVAVAVTALADRQFNLLPEARGAPILPLEARPVAVFVGDSYTAGAGSTTPGAAFTTRVAFAHGWREINLGRGGTGYIRHVEGAGASVACGREYCPSYTDMISDVVARDPAYVIVGGGRNELHMGADQSWADGVVAYFAALRQALPDAEIIAMSPLWDDEPPPANIIRMRAVVSRAVTAVGGIYLDLGDPLLGHPELLGPDGVHPNDSGHAAIAAAFNAAYEAETGRSPAYVSAANTT